MFGEDGLKLVEHLHQSLESCVLPLYDEDRVNKVFDEMNHLFSNNQHDVAECQRASTDTSSQSQQETRLLHTVLWRHDALERDRRCLVAYHYHRLMAAKEMRWNFGTVLPKDLRDNLTAAELDWLKRYNQNVAQYMAACGVDFAQYLLPSKSLLIEVRCTRDYGDLLLEDGTVVVLKTGSHHHLPAKDCEPLILQGVLEQCHTRNP